MRYSSMPSTTSTLSKVREDSQHRSSSSGLRINPWTSSLPALEEEGLLQDSAAISAKWRQKWSLWASSRSVPPRCTTLSKQISPLSSMPFRPSWTGPQWSEQAEFPLYSSPYPGYLERAQAVIASDQRGPSCKDYAINVRRVGDHPRACGRPFCGWVGGHEIKDRWKKCHMHPQWVE